jgi:two-component system, cell cycle response regulator DivK
MKKVLYVEDDAINALVVIKLSEDQFLISHVPDGESCIVCIGREKFDIILMDINLGRGKMDGVETMRLVKKNPSYVDVPIIAVTSYAMPEDKERFLGEGFDYYFEKPVERDSLITQINVKSLPTAANFVM